MTAWGCLVKGSEGAIFTSCPWNTRLELLPKEKFEGFQGPPPTLPRSPGHHAEWILRLQRRPEALFRFRDRRPDDRDGPVGPRRLVGRAGPSSTIRSAARSSIRPRPTNCCTVPTGRAGRCDMASPLSALS